MRRTPEFFAACGDIAGGAVVGVPELGLADAVHQVVDDVDRTRLDECRSRRVLVVRVQWHAGDMAAPAEIGEPVGVAGGGDDLVAVGEQGRHETRTDISGGAGDQDAQVFTVRCDPRSAGGNRCD